MSQGKQNDCTISPDLNEVLFNFCHGTTVNSKAEQLINFWGWLGWKGREGNSTLFSSSFALTMLMAYVQVYLYIFMSCMSVCLFHTLLKSVPWTLAEFHHNRIVQSPHENYFNFRRQHKEK